MKLTADQLRDFDEQGYIFMPGCFSEEEVALLATEAEDILERRTKHGLHLTDKERADFAAWFQMLIPQAV